MSTTTTNAKSKKAKPPGRPPELKIGPFQGGIGVAVWVNEVQTDQGPKMIRNISIAPRRYRDRQTGEWKDSGSFRPGDLSALILALENAWTQYTSSNHGGHVSFTETNLKFTTVDRDYAMPVQWHQGMSAPVRIR